MNRLRRFGALALAAALVGAGDEGKTREFPPSITQGARKILASELMSHVRVLCDPKLDGREAGGPGARRAANYIVRSFRKAGLRPGGGAESYIQTFEITEGHRVTSVFVVEIGKRRLKEIQRGEDYMPVHLPDRQAAMEGGLAFAGFGIVSPVLKFDEFEKLPVQGRAVLVFSGVPWDGQAAAWIRRAERRGFGSLEDKAEEAAKRGASLLLVVDDPRQWAWGKGTSDALQHPDPRLPLRSPIPIVHITAELAGLLTGLNRSDFRLTATDIHRERKPLSRELRDRRIVFNAEISGAADIGKNVLAVLPGRDVDLRREAVVIGAHFDHLGERHGEVYLGANDNASGVSAVLEIANSFAALPEPPRRTVIFAAFGAEELGRLGSSHYTRHPIVPMDRTVLMINFDMIGRNEADHVYAVGTTSSPELHVIHQEVNRHVGIRLTHPSSYRLGLSDHTAFYQASIPIMYLFGGRHPGYHTPFDTIDLLEPEKIEKITRLAFLTAWEVAERPKRITFEKRKE